MCLFFFSLLLFFGAGRTQIKRGFTIVSICGITDLFIDERIKNGAGFDRINHQAGRETPSTNEEEGRAVRVGEQRGQIAMGHRGRGQVNRPLLFIQEIGVKGKQDSGSLKNSHNSK